MFHKSTIIMVATLHRVYQNLKFNSPSSSARIPVMDTVDKELYTLYIYLLMTLTVIHT